MSIRNSLLSGLLAAAALALPGTTSAAIDIEVQVAPPAPMYEAVPPPRAGYTWAPGYWRWDGSRYGWAAGRWEPEHAGYEYVPEHWVQRDEHHWRFEDGRWEHPGWRARHEEHERTERLDK